MPRSGLAYSGLYEWLEAARWRGYSVEQFDRMDADRQALIIAHYRTHHQMEAVIAKAQADAMKKRTGR